MKKMLLGIAYSLLLIIFHAKAQNRWLAERCSEPYDLSTETNAMSLEEVLKEPEKYKEIPTQEGGRSFRRVYYKVVRNTEKKIKIIYEFDSSGLLKKSFKRSFRKMSAKQLKQLNKIQDKN